MGTNTLISKYKENLAQGQKKMPVYKPVNRHLFL